MNIANIMIDVIKKVSKGKAHEIIFAYNSENVCIGDGVHVYKIPYSDCLLDVEKLINTSAKYTPALLNILKNVLDTNELKRTGNIKVCDKSNCVELHNEYNNELIYIDEKLLKNFDKDCKFLGLKKNSPVYVCEHDFVVGVILPVVLRSEVI